MQFSSVIADFYTPANEVLGCIKESLFLSVCILGYIPSQLWHSVIKTVLDVLRRQSELETSAG